jgi:hypothetical protein
MLYNINQSSSTFCLDTKSGAKKSRTAQTAPRVCPASAQQHSNHLNIVTNSNLIEMYHSLDDLVAFEETSASMIKNDRRYFPLTFLYNNKML